MAASRPTLVEHGRLRFLVMDAPTDSNIQQYVEQLKRHDVVVVVRACDPTYGTQPLADAGIQVEEMSFTDGEPPPEDVVVRWLQLVDAVFGEAEGAERPAVAVHCVAGLGRAPVLVAIALVESGMDPFDAVDFIRKRRRGAINARQLKFIEAYKRRTNRRLQGCGCAVL